MREIKFRAWDGKKLWYFEFDDIYEDEWTHWPLKNSCIMQYTGLNDMKGKEIYEGDRVSYGQFYIGSTLVPPGQGTIEFNDGCFEVVREMSDHTGCLCKVTISSENIYVIGNKYGKN